MELSSFIGETEWRELEVAWREKRAAARPAGGPERFGAFWSAWEFDAVCRFTLLPDSDTFRLVTRGKQIPPSTYRDRAGASRLAAIRQFCASGATVNFARVELFSNRVLALNRGLEAALGCPARVHFFFTPGQSQGLGVHADHGHVLILQLQGTKTWEIYPESNHWPAAEAAGRLKTTAPETITLAAGGWLFLPEGVYHEVKNKGDEPSAHFTIGLQPVTWSFALERALDLARRSLPELRETLPVVGEAIAADEVERRLRAVQPFVARAIELEQYGRPVPATELAERAELDAANATTRFSWEGEALGRRDRADAVELSLPYRSAPLLLQAGCATTLDRMARLGSFTAVEFGGDAAEALLLCKFLTNVGVLRLGVKG